MRKQISVSMLSVFLLFVGVMRTATAQTEEGTLIGFSRLPAFTLAPGPRSGQFAQSANGITLPVASPPVQGVSSVLRQTDGTVLALSDNGYGGKANSADYILRFYHLAPNLKTRRTGTGTATVLGFTSLRDPDKKIPFPLVADRATYPGSTIPVANEIRTGRLLTGSDFDVESFRQLPDGTFWFGDEFGPFLLHTDATGKVLEAPVPVPNLLKFGANPQIQSPDNPQAGVPTPNLAASGGFEGMALAPDGKTLFCLLEKTVQGDPQPQRLLIYPFDTLTRRFSLPLFYRKEKAEHAIGELTAVNDHEFLVIERDNNEGEKAQFKRIFLLDINVKDTDGFVQKRQLLDLMKIADPQNLSRLGTGTYTMPFLTIESVAVINPLTVLVVHDNNFPGSQGRTSGQPEDTEFALIALPYSLHLYK